MRRPLLVGLIVGASLLVIPRLARGEAWYYDWYCIGSCSPVEPVLDGTEGPFETKAECERVRALDTREDFKAPDDLVSIGLCENREGAYGYRPPAGGGSAPSGEPRPAQPAKISRVEVGALLGLPYRVETPAGFEDATGATLGFDLRIQTGTKPEIGGEIVLGLQYSRTSTARYGDDARSMVFIPWLIGLTSTPKLHRGKRELRLDLGVDVGGLSRVGCSDCAAEMLPTHAMVVVARAGFDVYSGPTHDSGWGVDAVMQWSHHGAVVAANPASFAIVSPALLLRLSIGGKIRDTGATW